MRTLKLIVSAKAYDAIGRREQYRCAVLINVTSHGSSLISGVNEIFPSLAIVR
jgi:hypothetical protein